MQPEHINQNDEHIKLLALHEAQRRLELCLASAGLGIWTYNIATNKFWANDRANHLHGHAPHEVHTFAEAKASIYPEDRDRAQAAIAEAMQTRSKLQIEYRVVWRDGSIHWIASQADFVPSSEPGEGMFYGSVQDISERKRIEDERKRDEAALRESEAKYRALFDSIDEGFVVNKLLYNDEGKPFDALVLKTNSSFDRMMRTTNAVGKRAREIFSDAEASWFEDYGRVIETGESLRFENYFAALDSWFELYVSRVGGSGSRQFAIVFNDISDRKRAESNLTFLAEVSHDLARLTSIEETMDALSEKIGGHFNVSCCSFAVIDEAAGMFTVPRIWYRESGADAKGAHRISDFFNEDFVRTCRSCVTVSGDSIYPFSILGHAIDATTKSSRCENSQRASGRVSSAPAPKKH